MHIDAIRSCNTMIIITKSMPKSNRNKMHLRDRPCFFLSFVHPCFSESLAIHSVAIHSDLQQQSFRAPTGSLRDTSLLLMHIPASTRSCPVSKRECDCASHERASDRSKGPHSRFNYPEGLVTYASCNCCATSLKD